MSDISRILTVGEIRKTLMPVFKKHNVRSAILYGSYAKGCAKSDSDIDILVDSNLAGFKFMQLYCDVQDALGGVDLDLFDKYEIIPGGRADKEIKTWGVQLYRAD